MITGNFFLIFSPLDLAKLLISFSAGTVFNVFWEAYKPQCLSADFFLALFTITAFQSVSVGRLATTLVATKNVFIIFFPPVFPVFFFSVVTFSHRRSVLIKKPILGKLIRAPNNLALDPFPDIVSYFVTPWRPFWILQVVLNFS